MKVSYAMIRLIIEREQVTAITGRIATIDPPEGFQDADDAIYPHFAMEADRDIDDGLRRQAGHCCGANMLDRSARPLENPVQFLRDLAER
jgi:hypothetical protein